MIYRKIFVFPMFVCTLEKCFRKYFTLCVWSNVKQNKTKPTPKITGNGNHHYQPNPQPTTNSTSHNNPPPTTTHRQSQILKQTHEQQTHNNLPPTTDPQANQTHSPRFAPRIPNPQILVSTTASLGWSGWTKHAAKRSPEPRSSSRISQLALHETTRGRPAQILSGWLGWLGVAGMARGGWAESRGREQRAKAERRGREREREHSKASRVFWKENGLRKIFP